jgi:hypothetical protein
MNANITQRFGCLKCGYFTNIKCNIEKHNTSKKHIESMKPKILDPNCKHQCKKCLKKYKFQSSLWNHKQDCKGREDIQEETEETEETLKEQMVEMKKMMEIMMKNQQSTTNNINNTINNNYNIFLNEKCGNAVEFKDFIKGMDFCREDFEAGNLLKASAAEYTASIFANHLNKMTLYERPIHSFVGEDPNQLIAHYRHNNEWKRQSEIMILDEVYRDFDGDEPKDSFMYHIGNFHKRRREHFDMYHGGKKNHVSPNLNFTTYCEQQIDLVRKLLEMVSVSPTSGDGSEYLQVCEKTTLC